MPRDYRRVGVVGTVSHWVVISPILWQGGGVPSAWPMPFHNLGPFGVSDCRIWPDVGMGQKLAIRHPLRDIIMRKVTGCQGGARTLAGCCAVPAHSNPTVPATAATQQHFCRGGRGQTLQLHLVSGAHWSAEQCPLCGGALTRGQLQCMLSGGQCMP